MHTCARLERRVASYRAVEHALAIHGDIEATLHSLDGHHSQTHRNKIKQGCGEDSVGEGGRARRMQKGRDKGGIRDRTE